MLKRRDWLHLHGKSGGASSSDDETDESSIESQSEGTEDTDDAADGEAVESDDASGKLGPSIYSIDDAGDDEGDDEDDDRPRKRLACSFDDISDPDEDEQGDSEDDDVAADGITADHVIKAWSSNDPEVNNFKGIALRCVCCNVMLLNRAAYLSHLASKKHQNRLKQQKPDGAPGAIQLASEVSRKKEEETETHAERLERLTRLATASMAGPSTAAATARKKLEPQGVKAAEPTAQQTAAALKGASAGKEAKGRAAKHPAPASRGGDHDSLADGEGSQSDDDDPVLAAGRRTKLKAHLSSTGTANAGGGGGGGGGEDSGKRKRKRHGNKMGKRERQALKEAIASGEVPLGTKPVVERNGKKGKKGKRSKGPAQLVQGQQQQQGSAAEKRPNDAKAVARDTVVRQQQQQQQQQGRQTKDKKGKGLKQTGGLPAASPAAAAVTAEAVAVTSAGSRKVGGQTRPGSNHTSRGEGKDAATAAAAGKTYKASVGAAAKNGKKVATGVVGTGRKG